MGWPQAGGVTSECVSWPFSSLRHRNVCQDATSYPVDCSGTAMQLLCSWHFSMRAFI